MPVLLVGLAPAPILCLLNFFPEQGHGLCAEAGPGAARAMQKQQPRFSEGGPAEGTGCCALLESGKESTPLGPMM